MAMTSVDVPDGLLDDAMRVLGAKTKRETITTALEQVVQRGAQRDALAALAGMDFLQDLLEPEIRAQARR